MGKTRNAIDSDECNNNYENADVETEEAEEEEEPSEEEEEPSEEDPCEDGPVEESHENADVETEEADEEEEPSEEDPCEDGPVEENSSEEEQDEVDLCEEPDEEDPCEEEPSEEEPDEDSLHAPNSENLCEEEPNELLCEEESNEEASCEEELNKDPSCEGSREEECDSEPSEEPCEDPQEEHCESEPSEDPEPNEEQDEELSEEDPSEGSCEEEPSESEVPSEDDGETMKSNPEQKSMSANAMPVPKGKTGSLGINPLGTSHNMLNDVSVSEKVDMTRDRSKKRRSRWDIVGSNGTADGDKDVAKEKRKTRWSSDNCQLTKTAPLKLPDIANSVEVVKLQAQLLRITKRLRARKIVDDRPKNKRSPSPPPIYNNLGIKINSREARLRAKFMLQRQNIISELIQKNPNYKPPRDYTKTPFSKKLYIPCKEYPGYNFVGLIIGPRGNTQKRMENETGAKICLRGRGSVQEGKGPKKQRHISDKEDLHVLVQADNQFSLDSAVALVEKLLTPVKDWQNEHKLAQLKELAVLNGNLREIRPVNRMKMDPCDVCGDANHSTSGCPLTASSPGAYINKHEIKFLAETGGGFLSFSAAPLPNPYLPSVSDKGSHKSQKESDDANLFVGHLPQSVDDKKLVELFLPFGQLCEARVIRDRNTGLSRGYGFVKYTDRVNSAKAVIHMNGYKIDGKVLSVRTAGIDPSPVHPNAGSGGGMSSNQLPQYPGYAAIARNNPDPMSWPGPPGSGLPQPDNLFVKNSNLLPQNPFSGQHSRSSGPSYQPPPLSQNPFSGQHPRSSGPSYQSSPLSQNPFSGHHSLSSGPSYQPPPTSTLLSADVAASDELAYFPGYLKSFDTPLQLHQPSSSKYMPSSQVYFTPDSRHP